MLSQVFHNHIGVIHCEKCACADEYSTLFFTHQPEKSSITQALLPVYYHTDIRVVSVISLKKHTLKASKRSVYIPKKSKNVF